MSVRTARSDRQRSSLRSGSAALLLALMLLAFPLASGGSVSAHTGFESSTPAEGAVIDDPVSLVTLVFTGEATPAGDEFIALTPAGVVQTPTSVETIDNKLFSITFDPPLAGGEVGIRWSVRAADAHPIEGAFAFTVNAPAPTTTVAPTTTEAPPSTSAAPDVTSAPVEATPTDTADAGAAAAVVEPEEQSPTSTAVAAAVDENSEAATGSEVTTAQSLDEFLAVDNSVPGETTATVGRLIGLLGVALGLGGLAFVVTALRGRREELRHVLSGVRILGAVIVVGAAIEYVGVTRIASESLASGWSTAPGFATVLRIVGGIGLAVGLGGVISLATMKSAAGQSSTARSLSSAALEDVRTQSTDVAGGDPIVRWTPNGRSWPAMTGVVLIIASFWFDGHTVSKGFRPLHALVNSVHVVAGSVWVGGVVTMAAVIWSRYRSDRPMRVVELVVRFSKIATIALASVVAAGALMAFLVLDSFGELTGTPWGKILLLKTAAVGLAMIGGAYNHFRLLPALEAEPESPELLSDLRNTVTAEAIMLVFVVMVTAWLVAAAS